MQTLIPTPQQVIETYRPLIRLIVEALRRGSIHAQEYADWQDETVDRALAPSLVRKGAKRYLIEKDQDVNEEELDYETEFLPNLGLALRADGVQIKILRSAPGNLLPVPGPSISRQIFYQQQGLPFGEAGADAEPPISLRLVLHWSTDAEYSLDRVYLGCPRSGEETRSSVEAHWDEPVWRRHMVIADGQVQGEVQDHDIYLDAEATGSEG